MNDHDGAYDRELSPARVAALGQEALGRVERALKSHRDEFRPGDEDEDEEDTVVEGEEEE